MSDRQRSLDQLTGMLTPGIILRELDAAIGAGLPDTPFHLALVDPWAWTVSDVSVGRKDHGPGGTRLLMPVRVHAAEGLAVQVTGPVAIHVAGCGLGKRIARTVTLDPSTGDTDDVRWRWCRDRAAADAVRDETAQSWTSALWNLRTWSEAAVRISVRRAHARVSASVAADPGRVSPVLDGPALDDVVTEMIYGADRSRSSLDRLIEKCLRAHTFDRVDPLHYLHVNLTRDAAGSIARRIGDPSVGIRIRDVHRGLGPGATVDDICVAYRQRYRRGTVSALTVARALDTGPTVDARVIRDSDRAMP